MTIRRMHLLRIVPHVHLTNNYIMIGHDSHRNFPSVDRRSKTLPQKIQVAYRTYFEKIDTITISVQDEFDNFTAKKKERKPGR